MGHFYDDDRYGAISRKYFGLTKKVGGDSASGFTLGTGDPTKITHVTRYYPKAPIDVIKFGALVLATLSDGGTATDKLLARLIGRGASASAMASVAIKNTSTDISQYTIASIEASDTTDFPITQVKQGEYLAINTATAETDKGTEVAGTVTGTVSWFIDTVPTFDTAWDSAPRQYQA